MPEADHAYYLALRAKDEAGNISYVSNNALVVSGSSDANYLPGPPTRFRAIDAPSDSGGVVNLSWQRSSDDGQGKETVVAYHIYRDQPPGSSPVMIDSVLAGTTAYAPASASAGGSRRRRAIERGPERGGSASGAAGTPPGQPRQFGP